MIERILLDMETQRDFFAPGGSCYTPETGRAARNIVRLFGWVRRSRMPVLSTVLRVRCSEQGPLASVPHCVEDTEGEQKLPQTILRSCINLGLRNTTDLPEDIFDRHQQVIFEKRDTDIFRHARCERLISQLDTGTFILCGAGVAKGIMQAAIGLRQLNFAVILAEDAVADLGDDRAEMAYRCMEAKGVIFAPTEQIVAVPAIGYAQGRRLSMAGG